jgi:hypothetical protein
VPFWVLDGVVRTSASALERMAGTTRLELATSAVTAALNATLHESARFEINSDDRNLVVNCSRPHIPHRGLVARLAHLSLISGLPVTRQESETVSQQGLQ